MKKQFGLAVVALSAALAITFTACGGDSSSSSDEPSKVASVEDLSEDCDDGEQALVGEDEAAYTCVEGKWEADEVAKSSDSKKKSSSSKAVESSANEDCDEDIDDCDEEGDEEDETPSSSSKKKPSSASSDDEGGSGSGGSGSGESGSTDDGSSASASDDNKFDRAEECKALDDFYTWTSKTTAEKKGLASADMSTFSSNVDDALVKAGFKGTDYGYMLGKDYTKNYYKIIQDFSSDDGEYTSTVSCFEYDIKGREVAFGMLDAYVTWSTATTATTAEYTNQTLYSAQMSALIDQITSIYKYVTDGPVGTGLNAVITYTRTISGQVYSITFKPNQKTYLDQPGTNYYYTTITVSVTDAPSSSSTSTLPSLSVTRKYIYTKGDSASTVLSLPKYTGCKFTITNSSVVTVTGTNASKVADSDNDYQAGICELTLKNAKESTFGSTTMSITVSYTNELEDEAKNISAIKVYVRGADYGRNSAFSFLDKYVTWYAVNEKVGGNLAVIAGDIATEKQANLKNIITSLETNGYTIDKNESTSTSSVYYKTIDVLKQTKTYVVGITSKGVVSVVVKTETNN